jgi:hypothetical protein
MAKGIAHDTTTRSIHVGGRLKRIGRQAPARSRSSATAKWWLSAARTRAAPPIATVGRISTTGSPRTDSSPVRRGLGEWGREITAATTPTTPIVEASLPSTR